MAPTASGRCRRALVLADQVERRHPLEDPPAVRGSASQGDLAPAADGSRVVRRADDVRQLQERLIHPELAMANRLDPPGVEAGGEVRHGAEMVVERLLVDDLPPRQI